MERERAPDDLLENVWLSELSRLLPELKERYPDLPTPTSGRGEPAKGALFEAIARLVEALASRAPVVLLDDLQVGGRGNARGTDYVGALGGARSACAGANRRAPGGTGGRLRLREAARVFGTGLSRSMTLGNLTDEEVEELLVRLATRTGSRSPAGAGGDEGLERGGIRAQAVGKAARS